MTDGKELFEQALEHIGRLEYTEAETKLQRSAHIEARPSVLSNLAACQLKLNKIEEESDN